MNRLNVIQLTIVLFLSFFSQARSNESWDALMNLPAIAKDTVLYDSEVRFGYRGKTGVYAMPPSRVGVYFDNKTYYSSDDRPTTFQSIQPAATKVIIEGLEEKEFSVEAKEGLLIQEGRETKHPKESACVIYDLKSGRTFCGAYVILLADITPYACLSFMIKGDRGGETFEVGLNDTISNKREDSVVIGSIYRYLPNGITTNWQKVIIPIEDFYGPDLTRAFSIVFMFNEIGKGKFWIDDFRFHRTQLVDREAVIADKGYLLLDNFDHSDVNLLGRKCGVYTKFPSLCRHSRVTSPHYGDEGRSLELSYDKKSTGWCGYYTLLNQVDGKYYDLRDYESVSFMVRGKNGGEIFELGLADRNWINIGDSLKAGSINKYLPDGVTTEWQEVTIPLEDFGLLDFSEMGSFALNFNEKSQGTIYLDNIRFNLRKETRL